MDKLRKLERQIDELRTKSSTLATQVSTLESSNQSLLNETKSLIASNEDLEHDKSELKIQLQKKQDELDALLRRFFGRQSERFEDSDQLKFEFASQDEIDDAREGIEQAVEEKKSTGEKKKRKRRQRSERFPESLERRDVIIDLSDEEKEGLICIGEDIVESAHFSRPIVHINRKIYPKYIHPDHPNMGVIQSPRPPALIQGDRYDVSFASQIIAARLGYHLPIYRQEDMFSECGLYLTRSTLLNLQEAAARLLRPFARWLADLVRTDSVIGSDDTSIRLLLPDIIPEVNQDDPRSARVHEVLTAAKEKGLKSVSAKMWAYRGIHLPINVFDFTISRHRDGPDDFLIDHGYEGTLLGDCYGANTGILIRSSGLIIHAACGAHARRKVEAALDNHEEHSKYLLRLFRAIYDVEDESREMSSEDRLALRESKSAPLWSAMRTYLETRMTDTLKDEKITEAKKYILNQWEGLTKYLKDGGIPIDNNLCEQLMKQVAIGRKNWLFLGSVGSGYRTATLMTVVSSAIRNDLDVGSYLEDILGRLLDGRTDYESMRPDAWGETHPESIRAHRPSLPTKFS